MNKGSRPEPMQCSGMGQFARPGAMIGYVGVPHGVQLDGQALFFSQTGMQRGPAQCAAS